jgi:hypothetical protein
MRPLEHTSGGKVPPAAPKAPTPRGPSVPAPCGGRTASVQRKVSGPSTTGPSVPAPCGGRTASVQRKASGSSTTGPSVPAPCGGRSASVQRKAPGPVATGPSVPAPCGGCTGPHAQAPVAQRKLTFSAATAYLDADNGGFPALYKAIQDRAKAMDTDVRVEEDAKQATRAHYEIDAQGQALIVVRPRQVTADAGIAETDRNGIIIAMTHETQHAVDDLAPTSTLHRQVHGGDIGSKIMSEIHAHGAQAALAQHYRGQGARLPRADDLLAQSFTARDFDVGGTMFDKIVTYFKQYTGVNDTKAKERASEFIFLNWGEIEDVIAQVTSPAEAAKIGKK